MGIGLNLTGLAIDSSLDVWAVEARTLDSNKLASSSVALLLVDVVDGRDSLGSVASGVGVVASQGGGVIGHGVSGLELHDCGETFTGADVPYHAPHLISLVGAQVSGLVDEALKVDCVPANSRFDEGKIALLVESLS